MRIHFPGFVSETSFLPQSNPFPRRINRHLAAQSCSHNRVSPKTLLHRSKLSLSSLSKQRSSSLAYRILIRLWPHPFCTTFLLRQTWHLHFKRIPALLQALPLSPVFAGLRNDMTPTLNLILITRMRILFRLPSRMLDCHVPFDLRCEW